MCERVVHPLSLGQFRKRHWKPTSPLSRFYCANPLSFRPFRTCKEGPGWEGGRQVPALHFRCFPRGNQLSFGPFRKPEKARVRGPFLRRLSKWSERATNRRIKELIRDGRSRKYGPCPSGSSRYRAAPLRCHRRRFYPSGRCLPHRSSTKRDRYTYGIRWAYL